MAKAEEEAAQGAQARPAGRQEVWPTLWDKAQLAFPWGGATKLRRKPDREGGADACAAAAETAMTHSADFTVIYLSPRPWARFLELATRAPGKHIKGGWQSRLRKWCGRMDEAARSLTLCHAPEGKERLDDMTFLERAIEQKNVGGWQSDAFFIFAGSHLRFTALTIRPRPERGRKYGATGSPAGLSAASRRRDLPADERAGLSGAAQGHPAARAARSDRSC